MLRSAFPDLRFPVEELIAEGDSVVSRWTDHGTHQGEFRGIPPTNKHVSVTGIVMHRLAGGKFVEDREELDALGLLQQLGAMSSPGAALEYYSRVRDIRSRLRRRRVVAIGDSGDLTVIPAAFEL